MSSELDKYLQSNASEEQKAQLNSIKEQMANEGVHGENVDKNLAHSEAELHATPNPEQNLQYGGANEYDRPQAELKDTSTQKKDSLSEYSLNTANDNKPIENSMGNDGISGGMQNEEMER